MVIWGGYWGRMGGSRARDQLDAEIQIEKRETRRILVIYDSSSGTISVRIDDHGSTIIIFPYLFHFTFLI